MRILHLENTAGVAYALSRGQRELGHEADVLETYWSPLSFPHDKDLYYKGRFFSDAGNMRKVVREAKGYDIIHVHAGVHWKRFDVVAISQLLRKPVVVHYHGSETRLGYGLAYRRLWKHTIVGRPDLIPAHPNATFIRNPVIGVEHAPLPEGRLRVLHAFHNPETKGSAVISQALQELVDEGADLEFTVLEKVGHDQVIEEMRRSHVVIDQLVDTKKTGLASIIGVVALEAMAMGRAVVSSFDQEYRRFYPGCPVLAVAPEKDALKHALAGLAIQREELVGLSRSGPEYVREYHSPRATAEEVVKVYRKALGGSEGEV
jgi:glycosyltransferase involved in cell wall biosynthesis